MPTMKQLRDAGINAHLAPITLRLNAIGGELAFQQELERLAMQLAGVVEPNRLEPVLAEASRREELFTKAKTRSTTTISHPKITAMRSVLDDVLAGRFS